MLILQESYVTLSLDSSVPCVVLTWNGFVTSSDFRKAITTMLQFILENSGKYPGMQMLADTTKLGVVGRDTIEWMATEIDPQLVKAGMSKVAFIVPENDFTKANVKLYTSKVTLDPDKLNPAQFFTVEDAKAWLREK